MKKALLTGVAVLLLVGCFVGAAHGGEPYSDGFQRKVWAARLPGGPIKMLFVANYTALHDAYELEQRFEIKGVSVATTHRLSRGKLGISGWYQPTLLKTADTALNEVREGLRTDWQVLALRTPG